MDDIGSQERILTGLEVEIASLFLDFELDALREESEAIPPVSDSSAIASESTGQKEKGGRGGAKAKALSAGEQSAGTAWVGEERRPT